MSSAERPGAWAVTSRITGAGFGYASMLRCANAIVPPMMSTPSARMTMGRLARAKVRIAFSMGKSPCSPRCRRQRIVEKQRVLGGHRLAGHDALENLGKTVLLQARLHLALH